MSLLARHPGAIQLAREHGVAELRRHLELNPEEYERIRTPNDPATLAEAAEKFRPVRTKNFHLDVVQKVILNRGVGQRLFNSRWSIVSFQFDNEPRPLLTSDRPCLLQGNLIEGRFLLVLPLSPTVLFIACDEAATEASLRRLPPGELLDRVNRTAVARAALYVYGTDDSYLSLVEELLSRRAG